MNDLRNPFGWIKKLYGAAGRILGWGRQQARVAVPKLAGGWRPCVERAVSEAAVAWRRLIRLLIVLIGFAVFAGAEYGLARGIWAERFFLVAIVLAGGLVTVLTLRYPLNALLVWVVVSPFSTYLLRTYSAAGWNFITFDSVTFFLVFVATVFRALVDRVRPRKLVWGEALLIAFVAYVLLSIYVRGQLSLNSLKTFGFQIGIWPFIYFLVKANVQTERDLRKYAAAMMVAMAVITFSLWYEHFAGRSMYSLIFGKEIRLRWSDVGSGRAAGPFKTPIHSAQLLVPAALLALHLMSYARRPASKLVYLVLAITACLGLFFTYTRNNYISLGVCMLLAPFVCPENRRTFVGVLVAAVVATAVFIPRYMTGEFEKRMTAPTAERRLVFMQTSFNIIKHHPLFGVGWGNSTEATKRYVVSRKQYEGLHSDSGMPLPTLVHNTYLHITQENGLIGAALIYGAILHLFVMCWRVHRRAPIEGPLGKNFVGIIGLSFV
ncbi:MAG: O-antigen ligase family protein, partial [Armatimonadota bacterium]